LTGAPFNASQTKVVDLLSLPFARADWRQIPSIYVIIDLINGWVPKICNARLML